MIEEDKETGVVRELRVFMLALGRLRIHKYRMTGIF